jgi:LemA protein
MSAFWLVVAIVVIVAAYAVFAYNRLVSLGNLAREGWSGVDVQLRRRTDLVPNLVAAVKAYAAHERDLFEDISARRTSSVAAANVPDQAAAERALGGSLSRLIALAEGYPQLKADQNFRELQQQLAEIEDQLQMARRYYNGTVRNMNIRIQSLPDVLVARPTGFRELPYFELDDVSQAAVPTVELGRSPA